MIKGKSSFVSGIIFFLFGLFVFLNPDMIVKFISYFIGGVLIALGLYKTVNYYIQDKRNGIVNTNELGFGVTMVVLGILLVCLAGTIEFLTRINISSYSLYVIFKIWNLKVSLFKNVKWSPKCKQGIWLESFPPKSLDI